MTRPLHTVALGSLLLLCALVIVVVLARKERADPARCPPGSHGQEARCCGIDQQLRGGECAGIPRACPPGTLVDDSTEPGCVGEEHRVAFRGGVVHLAPSDWEAQGRVQAREIQIAPFELDAIEVTYARWHRCATAGTCAPLTHAEPGRPVTEVSTADAATFCRFEGGRLPRGGEWLLAAMGPEGRRYPWGQTGLVCRRAAFGLVSGPCGLAGTGPDVAGFRPDGASPDGVLDLAGNVAEWTQEPDGVPVARGGSYRSRGAAELKSWAFEVARGPAPHIGFRCAYDPLER